jgi:hypothetical protein
MLACYYCKRAFFDGEVITIRVVKHTEYPHHTGCYNELREKETLLHQIFGEMEPVDDSEHFSRTFWNSQVAGSRHTTQFQVYIVSITCWRPSSPRIRVSGRLMDHQLKFGCWIDPMRSDVMAEPLWPAPAIVAEFGGTVRLLAQPAVRPSTESLFYGHFFNLFERCQKYRMIVRGSDWPR